MKQKFHPESHTAYKHASGKNKLVRPNKPTGRHKKSKSPLQEHKVGTVNPK